MATFRLRLYLESAARGRLLARGAVAGGDWMGRRAEEGGAGAWSQGHGAKWEGGGYGVLSIGVRRKGGGRLQRGEGRR